MPIININLEQVSQFQPLVDTPTQYTLVDLKKNSPNVDINVEVQYGLNIPPAAYNPTLRHLTVARYDKLTQQRMINAVINKTRYYHPLKTYSINASIRAGKYVLKPAGGARSLALFYVDTNKISIASLVTNIELFMRGDNRDDSEAFEKMITDLGVIYRKGQERKPHESFIQVKDNIHDDYIVQEQNPFVENAIEYRVLITPNKELMFFTRPDLNDTYHGYGQSVSIGMAAGMMAADITEALSSPEFPLAFGSVDLWISEKDNAWGIYEYQPQMGLENIPADLSWEYLDRCATQFLEIAERGGLHAN